MNLTCAVIDDEPLARDLIGNYIDKTSFLTLAEKFSSAVSAISTLTKNPVDLVFLDIQMPDLDGIQFSRILPPTTKIIFTTAFAEYAVEGFRIEALDYLLKPISYDQFLQSANKALKWFKLNGSSKTENINVLKQNVDEEENFFYVKSDYKLIKVPFRKILYMEGLKDYLKIYVEEEPHPIVTLLSLKTMEEKLPSSHFIRIHRSYIVNMRKVRCINKGLVYLGDTHIPISDNYREEFNNYINKHLL